MSSTVKRLTVRIIVTAKSLGPQWGQCGDQGLGHSWSTAGARDSHVQVKQPLVLQGRQLAALHSPGARLVGTREQGGSGAAPLCSQTAPSTQHPAPKREPFLGKGDGWSREGR